MRHHARACHCDATTHFVAAALTVVPHVSMLLAGLATQPCVLGSGGALGARSTGKGINPQIHTGVARGPATIEGARQFAAWLHAEVARGLWSGNSVKSGLDGPTAPPLGRSLHAASTVNAGVTAVSGRSPPLSEPGRVAPLRTKCHACLGTAHVLSFCTPGTCSAYRALQSAPPCLRSLVALPTFVPAPTRQLAHTQGHPPPCLSLPRPAPALRTQPTQPTPAPWDPPDRPPLPASQGTRLLAARCELGP